LTVDTVDKPLRDNDESKRSSFRTHSCYLIQRCCCLRCLTAKSLCWKQCTLKQVSGCVLGRTTL